MDKDWKRDTKEKMKIFSLELNEIRNVTIKCLPNMFK